VVFVFFLLPSYISTPAWLSSWWSSGKTDVATVVCDSGCREESVLRACGPDKTFWPSQDNRIWTEDSEAFTKDMDAGVCATSESNPAAEEVTTTEDGEGWTHEPSWGNVARSLSGVPSFTDFETLAQMQEDSETGGQGYSTFETLAGESCECEQPAH
jgi:hypothetical protein